MEPVAKEETQQEGEWSLVLLPVHSLLSPGWALLAQIFRSCHSVPKPINVTLFYTHLLSINSPKEDHLWTGIGPQPGISRLFPGEPSALAMLWVSPASCSFDSAYPHSSSIMPLSQRHFGLKGHLQSRVIFLEKSAFSWARTEAWRYGFSQGVVCVTWFSAKTMQE